MFRIAQLTLFMLFLRDIAVMAVRSLVSVNFTVDQVLSLLGHEDGCVNPPQAAALLEVSASTVIRRITSGELKGFKYGPRSYRIPASEIAAYMAKSAASAREN